MNRTYQPGVLANARTGKQLHPQAQAMAGGMTYKPPVREAPGAPEVHSLDEEGSTPSPATTCPGTTKRGLPCMAYPGEDGLCIGHRRQAAADAENTIELRTVGTDGS